ncbi:hypothetical protein [Flavobacterium facile]|uniref:hypothetical protein n=1 Tax=Flavobacterium facile TaxID=2893174 RepID=UPI002E7A1F31|nr:hypothetical protein [Flavobacterium sp. T-12]
MKFKIVVVSVLLFLFSCKSNYTRIGNKNANYIPYYLKVYEADSLFLVNDYEGSYKILHKLFKKYEPINIQGYYEYGNYLASSVMIGKTNNLNNKIKKSYTDFGGIPICHYDSSKFNDTILRYSKFSKDELKGFKQIYLNKLNLELRHKIERMINEDQVASANLAEDSVFFYRKKHKKELDDIFLKYGYPNLKIIGFDNYFENSADLSLILIHQDVSDKELFLKVMLENLKKGNCMPSEYAAVYDRKIWTQTSSKKSKQYFGSFINMKDGSLSIPVLNPNKLDSIRKSIGLKNSCTYDWWRNNKMQEE